LVVKNPVLTVPDVINQVVMATENILLLFDHKKIFQINLLSDISVAIIAVDMLMKVNHPLLFEMD
jgi:hypothetical protein